MRYRLPECSAPWPGVKGFQSYDRIKTLVHVIDRMKPFWSGKAMMKHDVD